MCVPLAAVRPGGEGAPPPPLFYFTFILVFCRVLCGFPPQWDWGCCKEAAALGVRCSGGPASPSVELSGFRAWGTAGFCSSDRVKASEAGAVRRKTWF